MLVSFSTGRRHDVISLQLKEGTGAASMGKLHWILYILQNQLINVSLHRYEWVFSF